MLRVRHFPKVGTKSRTVTAPKGRWRGSGRAPSATATSHDAPPPHAHVTGASTRELQIDNGY